MGRRYSCGCGCASAVESKYANGCGCASAAESNYANGCGCASAAESNYANGCCCNSVGAVGAISSVAHRIVCGAKVMLCGCRCCRRS